MGETKRALFSDKVIAGTRTYFMDIKESVQGAKYLVIREAREYEHGVSGNRRVMVFEEHLLDFYNGLRKAISYFILHDDFPLTKEQGLPS